MSNVAILKSYSCFLVSDMGLINPAREKEIHELLQPCSFTHKYTPYDIQLIWQLAVALPGGS